MTDLMAVKFVDGSDSMIEGLAIPFGGPAYLGGKDFHGEAFGPDTDLALEWFPNEGRPFLYHHGLDPELKASVIGRQVERVVTDAGHWVKVQLDKRSKYMAHIAELIAQGGLSFSSGAVPHLVKTEADGAIKTWPWVELSGTPTPANPDAVAYAVKATDAIEHLAAIRTDVPDALKAAIESEVGSESEPFAIQADRIAVSLDAFAQRAEMRRDWRAQKGRGISAANRAEIAEVVESLRPFGETYQRLSELLARTDPEAVEAAKAEARAIEAEYLRLQSRMAGLPI